MALLKGIYNFLLAVSNTRQNTKACDSHPGFVNILPHLYNSSIDAKNLTCDVGCLVRTKEGYG